MPTPTKYSQADLEAMDVADILTLAASLGYSITETEKDAIIAEFLAQQG